MNEEHCPQFTLISNSPTAGVPFLDEFENGGAMREKRQGGLWGLSSEQGLGGPVRVTQLDMSRQVLHPLETQDATG